MAPFFKRLISKTSSKEPSVNERPVSASGTSSNSGRSRDGSVLHQSEPLPHGQSTPSSSVQSSASASSLPKLMSTSSDTSVPQIQRPLSMTGSAYNRRSVTGLPSPTASNQVGHKLPNAMYSPRVTNLPDGSTVNSKMVLIHGVCGEPKQAGHLLDGSIRVTFGHKQIPRQEVSVNGGVFKFMGYLVPGRNKISLEFFSSKLKDNVGSVSNQASTLTLFHVPAASSPPLHLAVLVASDSAYTIDNTPERAQLEGNGLGTAIAKIRMMAQMSQAVLAEYMRKNDMGLRSFRLEEEWTTGSALHQDLTATKMRNEPKVHVVQTERTVAEIRSLTEQGMLGVALEALERSLPSAPSHVENVAMIVLDSHWDAAKKVSEGHVNTVGGNGAFRISLLGSQFLWSMPSCLEDVESSLMDCTRLEGKCSADGVGVASSVWEMADMTLNAYFRNLLRLLGCTEKIAGIMSSAKDQHVSRSFLSREAFGITSKSPGIHCITSEHESSIHRLDALQLRFHPHLATPPDEFVIPAPRAFVWPVRKGQLNVTASAGITYIELFAGNDAVPCGFIDFSSVHAKQFPNGSEFCRRLLREMHFTEMALRNAMPRSTHKEKLRIVVHSYAAQPTVVYDVGAILAKSEAVVKHPKMDAFRSFRVGNMLTEGTTEQEVVWDNAIDLHAVMKYVRVYFDEDRVYGIEILYVDADVQLFGNKGGDAATVVKEETLDLDTRLAETPTGLIIWTGDSKPIQGIQLITSKGNYSPRYGNTTSGNPYRALTPRGYTLAGLSGAVGVGIENLRLLIKM